MDGSESLERRGGLCFEPAADDRTMAVAPGGDAGVAPAGPDVAERPSTAACARLLETELPVVLKVTATIARRSRLTGSDAEELRSRVLVKLIEDDYAVIRKFQGRSTFKTYLTVVIHRVALDLRVSMWGKWRPTAAARREGPLAVEVDRLIMRSGLSFGQACAAVETTRGTPLSPATRSRLRAVLTDRTRRHHVGDDLLVHVADTTLGSDRTIEDAETAAIASSAAGALAAALAGLPALERRMLTLRFRDGLPLSTIGQRLSIDQKTLYRRFARLLRSLRTRLEAFGVRGADLASAIGREAFDLPDLLSSDRA